MCSYSKEIKSKIKSPYMKHIKKFTTKQKKETTQEIKFDSKSLVDKEAKPGFKTEVEDNEKVQKEFKKSIDKIEKFESFIDIHIDNIENLHIEPELELDEEEDDDMSGYTEEDEGCGCCDDCTGQPGCDCGCQNCECGQMEVQVIPASDFISNVVSEGLKWHLDNNLPVTENIFRPGSEAFFTVIKEARRLFDLQKVELCPIDKELFESTDIGNFAHFRGEIIPLDLPMENIFELNEAEYHGKEVKLNYPMRSSGPKKYKVYVKNPKTGKVICVNFGDVKGGLTSKVNDPKARKSFVARHRCKRKWKPEDKLSAGYWSCHLPRYKHLVNTTYSGYW